MTDTTPQTPADRVRVVAPALGPTMDQHTYRLGRLDTSDGHRPLIRSDGEVVDYVQSNEGPGLVGEMTEAQARERWPRLYCWRIEGGSRP